MAVKTGWVWGGGETPAVISSGLHDAMPAPIGPPRPGHTAGVASPSFARLESLRPTPSQSWTMPGTGGWAAAGLPPLTTALSLVLLSLETAVLCLLTLPLHPHTHITRPLPTAAATLVWIARAHPQQ